MDWLYYAFLMLYLFSKEGLPVVNPPYFALVELVVGLSFFIVTWVLVVMLYQVACHRSIRVVESESNLVEFL